MCRDISVIIDTIECYLAEIIQLQRTISTNMKLIELKGDLFEQTLADDCQALAHCISEDCRMGKGIALNFKRKFGGVEELQKQVGAGIYSVVILF